ncbi:MAG: hypothetical protein MMC23_003650 [Stictis urceolatum]|nr:hypothetical protein [Stictis urceolata]
MSESPEVARDEQKSVGTKEKLRYGLLKTFHKLPGVPGPKHEKGELDHDSKGRNNDARIAEALEERDLQKAQKKFERQQRREERREDFQKWQRDNDRARRERRAARWDKIAGIDRSEPETDQVTDKQKKWNIENGYPENAHPDTLAAARLGGF